MNLCRKNALRRVAMASALIAGAWAWSPMIAQTGAPGTTAPPTRGQTTGVETGTKIEIRDVVKTIGDLIKPKKKVETPPTDPVITPKETVETKPDVVIETPPKVDVVTNPKTTTQTPKPRVVAKPDSPVPTPQIAAKPVPVPVVTAEPVAELVPEPLPEPVVAEPVAEAVAEVKPAVASPPDTGWSLYAILAAIAAALVSAGLVAKAMMKPKVSLDCALGNASSNIIGDLAIEPPEISFRVTVPSAQTGAPANLAII